MKSIVIYSSKTGFTKKYAEWIAEDLGADLYGHSEVTVNMLADYDVVIYGGGLYAVGVNGVKFITDNLEKMEGKKVIVFATGATPARSETINEVRDKNFTLEQQKQIRFFYLRGGFDYSKLKMVDKLLMNLLKLKLRRKKELTADDKGMLNAYDQAVDFRRKQYIAELIAYARQ